MATIEERFQAAVNVIKGLPKNGPYQPSTGMMLKFYGYYKQATEGPPKHGKPAFWDIIGKAKWDAWNDNRHLSKQQAMEKYVEDLREIIETMSFTENVQNFVGSISGLDNINLDELDMIVPGMREIAESHPNSPFNSRTNSPQHGVSANKNFTNGNGIIKEELPRPTPITPLMNGHVTQLHVIGDDISSDADDGLLSEPTTSTMSAALNGVLPEITEATTSPTTYRHLANGNIVDQSDDEYGDPIDIQHDISESMQQNTHLLKQIQETVLRMNTDILTVTQRMNVLEKSVHEIRAAVQPKPKGSSRTASARQYPKWWPFDNISPGWFVLLILWPFVVKRMSRMLATPRQKY